MTIKTVAQSYQNLNKFPLPTQSSKDVKWIEITMMPKHKTRPSLDGMMTTNNTLMSQKSPTYNNSKTKADQKLIEGSSSRNSPDRRS